MKITRIAILMMVIAAVLYILIPALSWAEDATGLHSKGNKDHEVFTSWIGVGAGRLRRALQQTSV